MKSKSERFSDARRSRFEGAAWENNSDWKRARKNAAKACAKQWKALREDRRFALPELVSAMRKHGQAVAVIRKSYWTEMLKSWPEHPAIPSEARYYAGAHPSETQPGKIACYPTLADARRGREVIMAPGRFFAACFPTYTPAEVQTMAEAYAASAAPVKIHYAKEADHWCSVYYSARGFSSCMAATWTPKDINNPIRFYAHPENNLRLSYLTHNGKPDGETVARAIVNDAKKLYVRVYGDARLARALEEAGYRQNACGALDGEKCVARSRQPWGQLIAPYLDGVGHVEWDGVSDTCAISEDGNWDACCTGGMAEEQIRTRCDVCEDVTDEDELTYSEHHEQHICPYCISAHFTLAVVSGRGCHANEDYVGDGEVVYVGERAFLCDTDLLLENGYVADEDGDWQDVDDCVYLDYLGEYVLIGSCTRLDVAHEGDEWARDDDVKTVIVDGEKLTVHEDYDGPEDAEEEEEDHDADIAA